MSDRSERSPSAVDWALLTLMLGLLGGITVLVVTGAL